jgi:hypothetical protein
LWDDCRSAIAHVTREPWRGATLEFDSARDQIRIRRAFQLTEAIARHYIVDVLDLTKTVSLQPKTKDRPAEYMHRLRSI